MRYSMPIKKNDKPNKTIQCIRLLKILKSKRYCKKSEIAYLLGEETTRNINNYKNTLYDAGYPIHFRPGRNGGYYLEFDSILPSMRPSALQLKSLSVAYDYLLKEGNIPHKQLLLDYLGGVFLENEQSPDTDELALYGHFPLSMTSEELERRYYILQTAIDSKRKVKILYRGYVRDGERVIHPYKLFKFTNWMIFAREDGDYMSQQMLYNKFKLHRILEIELLDETYKIPWDYQESDYFDQEGMVEPLTHVKLIIKGRLGRMLDEKIYGQNQVVTCLDEKTRMYLFEADMRNQMVIRKFILSFGSQCEVIEPVEIREEIIREARNTLSKYERYEQPENKNNTCES